MTPSPTYGRRFVMTILKKRLAVLALGLAVTALASPSYARGAGRHISASDPTTLLSAVGKPDSGPALGSRAGTRHQWAVVTARVPGPNRNRTMTHAGRADHSTPVQHRTAPQTARNAGASDAQLSEAAQVAAALPRVRGNHPRHESVRRLRPACPHLST